jgi:hypothetical protein
MSYARTRRRLLAWRRYELRCERVTHTIRMAHTYNGYVKTYAQANEQGRYSPIGVRDSSWIFRVK